MAILKPINGNVVVRPVDSTDVSDGGIILTGTAVDQPDRAEVIAVGPGEMTDKGQLLPMYVKPGDIVVIGSYANKEKKVELDGEQFLIITQEDIFAIVN